MKTKLLALLLMAGGALFAETHFSVGVQIGPPAPVVVNEYRPPWPGPGYVWIDGYYDAYQNWIPGYWALPPYAGAYWVAPQFYGGRYSAGYWGGVRNDYRNDYRFENHEARRRDHDRREPEVRERGGGFDRGHGQGAGRGDDFRQGFRR